MSSLRRRLVRYPLRRRSLARLLFGVDVPPLQEDDYYYDLVTLALVRAARRQLAPGSRVLDLGTGAHAIVGLALWRSHGAEVTAVDVNPRLVELAAENARRNRAPIEVLGSRFFDAVSDRSFDAVLFNPPYVPRSAARHMDLPVGDRRSQWDGGEDGTDVLRAFLGEYERRAPSPLALVGLNRWWVDDARFHACLDRHPALRLRSRSRCWPLPGTVYALHHAEGAPSP